MSIAPGNSNFTKLFDSGLESNVFEALVNSGVLPQGFQVIVGTADVSTLASGQEAPVLGSDGNQIVLAQGQQIAFLSAAVTTTLAAGTGATLQVGLAGAAGANINLGTTLTAAVVFGTANTAGIPITNYVVVGSTNKYLSVAAGVETFTDGAIKVVLVVV